MARSARQREAPGAHRRAPGPTPTAAWWHGHRGTILLFALTLAAYLPALGAGFVWDDDDYVTANRTVQRLDGLRRIWLEPGAVPQYYPLTFSSLWIDYHLWGLAPLAYHAVNVLLHALNAVLVWRILERLAVPAAWMAAAVFALHPVHVESVAWVTERKNVLSGAFYLGALLAYLSFASTVRGERPWGHYALALGLFAAALLSKTVTCTLPGALLVLLWWQRGRIGWREALPLLPMLILGASLAAVTMWMEKHHVGAAGVDWQLSFLDRCLVAGRALWFYLASLLWPSRLTFIYPRWEIDSRVWWQHLFPLTAAATAAGLFAARNRLGRGPIAAALFFAVTLAPALGFVDVFPMRYSFVADHFQYLASLGPIALATAGTATLLARVGAPMMPAAAAVLVILGLLTARQATIYGSLESLWRDTLAKDPRSWMAHNNLGLLLFDRGQVDEAMAHYAAALAAKPDDTFAHNNLGNALAAQGRYGEAMAHYREALRLDPQHAEAHNNLGNAFAAQDQLAAAAEEYAAAVRLKPRYPEAHNNLGNVLAAQGRFDAAEREYREGLRLDPDYADAHRNLGVVLAEQGHGAEALAHYAEAVRLRPGSAQAHHELAQALAQQGRTADAIAHEREALRRQPGFPPALERLAWLLATAPDPGLRQPAEAVALAERARASAGHPDPAVLDTLAAALAATGRFDAAVETAEEALRLARAAGQRGLADAIEARTALYRTRTAYRE